jgi:hypothetical protein
MLESILFFTASITIDDGESTVGCCYNLNQVVVPHASSTQLCLSSMLDESKRIDTMISTKCQH